MSALSVLHVVAPTRVGGLETVVLLLARGMAARGHAVRVLAILDVEPDGHPFIDALRQSGVDVLPMVMPGRSYRRERAAVDAAIARSRPQVVHTHGYRPDVVDSGVARRRRIPVATTVHGFTRGGWKNRLYEHLQRRWFRRFDAVIAVSRPLMDELRASGVPSTVLHLIPNAYRDTQPPLARADARRLLGIPEDRFVIGWVGRFSGEKGADVMLDALASPALASAFLSFVGDGREADALRARAASLGVESRVTWHGSIPAASRIYPAFDTFALTSRTEGTPIALFEAMAAALPIVAARVGGVPDVVGEGEAWLVPAESPASVAAAIREVMDDPARAAARGKAARGRLETTFAIEPWISRYEALYHTLATAPSTPAR